MNNVTDPFRNNAVENNYLSDKNITTFTEKYANAKTESEKEQLLSELNALVIKQQNQALAMGISVNDQKAELEKLRQLVASPECGEQCRQLAQYSISILEPVVNDTKLHEKIMSKLLLQV